MSPANPSYLGREFSGTPPYVVSAAKIAEFAAAVGATDPIHFDADLARRRGYDDVVAPLTFAVVISQRAEAEYINDPGAGIDFSQVVHSEQGFTAARPLVAGDAINARVVVDQVRTRGPLTMVTTTTELRDGAGAVVGTATSSLAIREGESA